MVERRRKIRTEIDTQLVIKRVDEKETKEIPVCVTDVSATGLGFTSSEALELDAVYEGELTIWTKEVISVLVKIIRIQEGNEQYTYGAVFVGLPDFIAERISIYQTVEAEMNRDEEL